MPGMLSSIHHQNTHLNTHNQDFKFLLHQSMKYSYSQYFHMQNSGMNNFSIFEIDLQSLHYTHNLVHSLYFLYWHKQYILTKKNRNHKDTNIIHTLNQQINYSIHQYNHNWVNFLLFSLNKLNNFRNLYHKFHIYNHNFHKYHQWN